MTKQIDFSLYHSVLVAERGVNTHLIEKGKQPFGTDPALCGLRPLMLGWQPAASQFLCKVCDRLAR